MDPQQFCEIFIQLLSAWPTLAAALQSGGLEVKSTALIGDALSEANQAGLVVMREYQHIDYVLIVPASVGLATLQVDTVLEVKFNYARQIGEIAARLPAAVVQSNHYRTSVGSQHAYVLYFLAAPFADNIPPHPRDSGWGYWNSPMPEAIEAIHNASLAAGAPIVGEAQSLHGPQLYCVLIECPQFPN